jgi:hypothetical protein
LEEKTKGPRVIQGFKGPRVMFAIFASYILQLSFALRATFALRAKLIAAFCL